MNRKINRKKKFGAKEKRKRKKKDYSFNVVAIGTFVFLFFFLVLVSNGMARGLLLFTVDPLFSMARSLLKPTEGFADRWTVKIRVRKIRWSSMPTDQTVDRTQVMRMRMRLFDECNGIRGNPTGAHCSCVWDEYDISDWTNLLNINRAPSAIARHPRDAAWESGNIYASIGRHGTLDMLGTYSTYCCYPHVRLCVDVYRFLRKRCQQLKAKQQFFCFHFSFDMHELGRPQRLHSRARLFDVEKRRW